MRYLTAFVLLLSLSLIGTAQENEIKLIGVRDTSKYDLQPGFYMGFTVDARSQGFKDPKSNNYYFVDPSTRLLFSNLDSIYQTTDDVTKQAVINFDFNKAGEVELKNFTIATSGFPVVLLINKKIYGITTVAGTIFSGLLTMNSKITAGEIAEIRSILKK